MGSFRLKDRTVPYGDSPYLSVGGNKKGEKENVALNKEVEQIRVEVATSKNKIESLKNEIERIKQRKIQLEDNLGESESKIKLLEKSKKEIQADLIFGGQEDILTNLKSLHYNINTDALDLKKDDAQQILRRSFQRLRMLNFEMKWSTSKGISSLLSFKGGSVIGMIFKR